VGIDTIDSGQGQILSLSSINVHPKYDSVTKENDIAILTLRNPINFNDPNVAKICLPNVRKGEQSRYPEVDSPIVAIGWGRISSGGSPSNALRQVTVKTVDNKDRTCKVSIKNTDLQFCAAIHGGGKGM
jgi:transmembrane serine protease 2